MVKIEEDEQEAKDCNQYDDSSSGTENLSFVEDWECMNKRDTNMEESISQRASLEKGSEQIKKVTPEAVTMLEVSEYENVCECKNLKGVVKKLQTVSDKLASDLLFSDSFDQFGKYLSTLLRGLPLKKVLALKQKLVSDVIEALLVHERGENWSSTVSTSATQKEKGQIFPEIPVVNPKTQLVHKPTPPSSFKVVPFFRVSIPESSAKTIPIIVPPCSTSQSNVGQISSYDSITTVSTSADGTLEAVILPSRDSTTFTHTKLNQPVTSESTIQRGQKRKQTDLDVISKRWTTPITLSSPVLPPSTVTSAENDDTVTADENECSIDIEEGQELEQDIKPNQPMIEPLPCTDNDLVTIKQEPLELEDTSHEEAITVDTAQLFLCDLCSTRCATASLLAQHVKKTHPDDRVLMGILNMQATMSDIVERLRSLEEKVEFFRAPTTNTLPVTEDEAEVGILSLLPITKNEDFQALELKLKETPHLKKKFVKILMSVGGRDHKTMTVNVMRRLISDTLAVNFSYTGKKGFKEDRTEAFGNTEICKNVHTSVRKAYPDTTHDIIKKLVMGFLNQAKTRLNRRDQDKQLGRENIIPVQEQLVDREVIPAEEIIDAN